MAIKIVTDSTVGLEREYIKANDVTVVPLKIIFPDEEYTEGFPGEFDSFYDKMAATKAFPKTSQPSPDQFKKIFKKITDEGDEVICITLCANLSGTYNSARLASEKYSDKVSVIDSTTACQAVALLVYEMRDMILAGKNRAEIVAHIEKIKHNTSILLVPETLEYFKRGGRIGTVSAVVGSLLNLKPILQYKHSKLTNIKKCFGLKKAIMDIVSMIPKNIKSLAVACSTTTSTFYDFFKEKVTSAVSGIVDKAKIFFGQLTPVVCAHTGPGTLGLGFIEQD